MADIAAQDRRGMPWRTILWAAVAALLALPAIAMQFTDEVNWTASDFVFAAVMFGGTGLLLELAARASASWAYRGGVAVALAAAFLLIWINAAVGIIGDEDNPQNGLYLGEILIALTGAVLARFRAQGMAAAMAAAGIVQAAIALYAFAAGLGASEPPGPFGVLSINLFFAGLWLLSAGLFRKAVRVGSTAGVT
ncbi:MAG TPA: hypothetical protein VF702_12405 [Allosphingosinicella sp.]